MPPLVSTFSPGDLVSGSLQDEAVLDERTFVEGSVDDGLGCDRFSSSLSLVGGDDDSRFGVDDSVPERFGGETSKDDRVHSSQSSARQERDGRFGYPINSNPSAEQSGAREMGAQTWASRWRQSADDGIFGQCPKKCGEGRKTYVALLDTKGLEDVSGLANLLEELLVGDLEVLSRLVGFPNDGGLNRSFRQ